jgi:NADH-quinone oxidoreductase subunit F
MKRIVDGYGRPEDLQLLVDVCDNIAPGLAFPYPMTTICFLGPSAAMPIISALQMFPEEFEARVADAVPAAH